MSAIKFICVRCDKPYATVHALNNHPCKRIGDKSGILAEFVSSLPRIPNERREERASLASRKKPAKAAIVVQ